MRRVAVPLMALVMMPVMAGCREDSGSEPPPQERPGTSVEHRIDDIESTLDRIESELSER